MIELVSSLQHAKRVPEEKEIYQTAITKFIINQLNAMNYESDKLKVLRQYAGMRKFSAIELLFRC